MKMDESERESGQSVWQYIMIREWKVRFLNYFSYRTKESWSSHYHCVFWDLAACFSFLGLKSVYSWFTKKTVLSSVAIENRWSWIVSCHTMSGYSVLFSMWFEQIFLYTVVFVSMSCVCGRILIVLRCLCVEGWQTWHHLLYINGKNLATRWPFVSFRLLHTFEFSPEIVKNESLILTSYIIVEF